MKTFQIGDTFGDNNKYIILDIIRHYINKSGDEIYLLNILNNEDIYIIYKLSGKSTYHYYHDPFVINEYLKEPAIKEFSKK